MKNYKGVIVEESLTDNRILNNLELVKVSITDEENPLERWHIYTANVSKDDINELSKHLKNKWYMHFWKDRNVIAIFKDAVFEFNYDDKATWKSTIEFGISIGIPENQLDFPID